MTASTCRVLCVRICSMLHPQQLAPLPPWIVPSTQPCCSWLGAAQHTPAHPAPREAANHRSGQGQPFSPCTTALDPSSKHKQRRLLGQQQVDSIVGAPADEDGAPAADGPAVKREAASGGPAAHEVLLLHLLGAVVAGAETYPQLQPTQSTQHDQYTLVASHCHPGQPPAGRTRASTDTA